MSCPLTQDVERAALMLRQGKLVAFRTETVYGLGGNILEESAVARIYAAKQRPFFDPLIVHFAELSKLRQAVREFPEALEPLAERYWPGPLTLVLPKSDEISDLVTSGLDTVAVRVPGDDLARELIRLADVPVAAPSANQFGRISPTTAQHVADQLGDDIDLILDGGPCRIGVESTVLQWTSDGPVLLRFGGLPLEEIEAIIGPVQTRTQHAEANSTSAPAGPGMLSKHYAPRTRLIIVDDIPEAVPPRCGLMTWQPIDETSSSRFAQAEVLSPNGDLTEATANFYAAMRRLDAGDVEVIMATRFPDEGLGRALNDRLQRASVRE